MTKRPIDKTKKSNIKCEHCKHWDEKHLTTLYTCRNKNSERYGEETNYYNRCKKFEWVESEEQATEFLAEARECAESEE